MLSDRDLVIASATMLTGILLIFTLFDFSVDEEITYIDYKIQVEELDKELDELRKNFISNSDEFYSDDTIERCRGSFVSFEEYLECWDKRLWRLLDKKAPMEEYIYSYEENKAKETFLLTDKLQLLSLIIYALAATSIFAILHSMKTKHSPIAELFAPVCFIFAWIFVFMLALNLSGI